MKSLSTAVLVAIAILGTSDVRATPVETCDAVDECTPQTVGGLLNAPKCGSTPCSFPSNPEGGAFGGACNNVSPTCSGFRNPRDQFGNQAFYFAPNGTRIDFKYVSQTSLSVDCTVETCICPEYVRAVCYKCGQELDCIIEDEFPDGSVLSDQTKQAIVNFMTIPESNPIIDGDSTDVDFCVKKNNAGLIVYETGQQNCENTIVGFESERSCCLVNPSNQNVCPVLGPTYTGAAQPTLSNVAYYKINLPHCVGTSPPTPTPPPTSGSWGDPHFATWSGEHFDFQGECDLLLVDNPGFKGGVGMHIHGRTKLHGTWSAFSSVAVKMGEDILEIHGSDIPLINGVAIPVAPMEYASEFLFPLTMAGFSVTVQNIGPNSRRHIIHLGNGERLYINNFKEFVDFEAESPHQTDFMGTTGMLGDYNSGKKLGRDGVTVIEDEDIFGQEWQVRDSDPQLFSVVDGPQYPVKCNMPEKLTAEQRHLRALNKKVSEEDAKNACAKAKAGRMQNCIADVFGSDNLEMAGIYETHSL